MLQLQADLKDLKIHTFYDTLMTFESLDTTPFIDTLLQLIQVEKKYKDVRVETSMVKVAGFPKLSLIDDFKFDFQPTLSQSRIRLLQTLEFIAKAENIIFTGTPGVGKTHLSTGIGIHAARARISTYFIKAQRLMTNLRLAYDENRLDARLKHYSKYKLLIIDELGYIPFDKIEAKIFFQLIDRRYEQKSTIITSNISIEKWYTIFDDIVLAQAIVDRLVHHSHIFNINGKSYRLKDLAKSPKGGQF